VDPDPSFLIYHHHSSGFQSISSTPDNISKTSSFLSEDSIDEKEGKQANRTSSLEIINIYRQAGPEINTRPPAECG